MDKELSKPEWLPGPFDALAETVEIACARDCDPSGKTGIPHTRLCDWARAELSALRQSEVREPSEAVVERVANAIEDVEDPLYDDGGAYVDGERLARAALAAHDGEGLLREAIELLRPFTNVLHAKVRDQERVRAFLARIDTHLSRIGQDRG